MQIKIAMTFQYGNCPYNIGALSLTTNDILASSFFKWKAQVINYMQRNNSFCNSLYLKRSLCFKRTSYRDITWLTTTISIFTTKQNFIEKERLKMNYMFIYSLLV